MLWTSSYSIKLCSIIHDNPNGKFMRIVGVSANDPYLQRGQFSGCHIYPPVQ